MRGARGVRGVRGVRGGRWWGVGGMFRGLGSRVGIQGLETEGMGLVCLMVRGWGF